MTEKVAQFKKKFEGCDYCGAEKQHRGDFSCPRIKSVEIDDQGYTVHLRRHWESVDAAPVDS